MSAEGMPGGCNPADALNKLATARGIRPPVFELVGLFDTDLPSVLRRRGLFWSRTFEIPPTPTENLCFLQPYEIAGALSKILWWLLTISSKISNMLLTADLPEFTKIKAHAPERYRK